MQSDKLINPNIKVSIITTTYNSGKHIKFLLDSIKCQKYKNIEHLIIDSFSTDKTLKIIKKYNKYFKIKIIRKKCSIYEGFNIGLKKFTGDIVTFIGSDDQYASFEIINEVVNNFNNKIDYLYGNVKFVNRNNNKTTRIYKSGQLSINKFRFGFMPGHTTIFFSKKIIKDMKNYNLQYKIASDFDFCLRTFLNRYKSFYLNKIISINKENGISNKNFKNILKSNIEILKILKVNKIYSNSLLILTKLSLKFIRKFIF